MNRKWILFFILVIGITGGSGTGIPAAAQEELPLEIRASVFFLSQDTMNALLKDGISPGELDDLQDRLSKEYNLLSQSESIVLKVGENPLEIPIDRIDSLWKAAGSQVVVFFFDFTRPKEVSDKYVPIERRSYILHEDSSGQQEKQIKTGKWRIPSGYRHYRLFDFRNASFFKSPKAVFELNLDWNGENKNIKVILAQPSS